MARALLFGTAVAPGIAIGKVVRTHQMVPIEERFVAAEEIDIEVHKLHEAAKAVQQDLQKAKKNMQANLAEFGHIIQAHIMISKDPRLISDSEDSIREQRLCAPWALQKTVEALSAAFLDIDDPYLQERALDLRAVGMRMQCQLAGKEYIPMTDSTPSIHMAEDLSPVDTLDLPTENILALIMAEGGITSHTAILARSLNIPTLMGVTGLMRDARDGDIVIVDALKGRVYIDPNEQELALFTQRKDEYYAWEANVRKNAPLAAVTLDDMRIEIQANVEKGDEVANLATFGAEGIGLYRTEFAYLRHRQLPSEAQLYKEYVEVVQKMAPQQVIFRTLDVGADKMLHGQLQLKENNPSLGLRGIRFCMRHKDLLYTQLRAIMRAALKGNVAIMLPMITCLEEVLAVKRIIAEVSQDLHVQGIAHAQQLPMGVMIEVPSAVFIADILARHCDFFSIGTNDLVHYLLGIDRGNKHVAYLHQPLHPAVTRALKRVVDCAHREGIGVSICGEMAADPYCLAVLLGLRIDNISATPQSIPGIKALIRNLNASTCQDLANTLLASAENTISTRIVVEKLSQEIPENLAFYTSMIHKS